MESTFVIQFLLIPFFNQNFCWLFSPLLFVNFWLENSRERFTTSSRIGNQTVLYVSIQFTLYVRGAFTRERNRNSLVFCQTSGGYPQTKLLRGFLLFPLKKKEIVPNFAKGGAPPLVKDQTISGFLSRKGSLSHMENILGEFTLLTWLIYIIFVWPKSD